MEYSHGSMQLLQHIENICHHCYFLELFVAFLFFNHLGELMYDQPQFRLFYDICNAIDQRYERQIHYPLLILLSFFDIFVKENQMFLNDFIGFNTYHSFFITTL